jgi:hypothetical protein
MIVDLMKCYEALRYVTQQSLKRTLKQQTVALQKKEVCDGHMR